jgi:hypothetical protein
MRDFIIKGCEKERVYWSLKIMFMKGIFKKENFMVKEKKHL